MSFREDWKAAQERDSQQPEAGGASHRRYAKAWELHKLGVPVMSSNGWPDPALSEEALDKMLTAERGRRATLYERFARARTVTVFDALGVQILTADDTVYTIGSHDPLTQTNSSQLLGLLAGAEAMVTDGSQGRSPGHAVFWPLSLTAGTTETVTNAVIIFSDGTVHAYPLHGSSELRVAQKQVMQFNTLAGTAAPEISTMNARHAGRLRELQELWEAGLLTQEEYDAKRAEIIASI
jgi:hypothetical protein